MQNPESCEMSVYQDDPIRISPLRQVSPILFLSFHLLTMKTFTKWKTMLYVVENVPGKSQGI